MVQNGSQLLRHPDTAAFALPPQTETNNYANYTENLRSYQSDLIEESKRNLAISSSNTNITDNLPTSEDS
ncbi:unnamed protein product [Clavelina lepadiformis]|uniref:Uncharacterized protein n=1 Tax=Clavelina lepadiformis TaxID=159417 RepID=A0ABP0FY28_CLALP